MKIRIGICDDSDHDRHYLKSIIKNYFKGREIEPEIVEYGSGEEFFRKPDVEILFLDIEMNALDGIMVKNELQKLQAETRIVFTTSHNDLMRDAFGKQVFGFLVKRVSPKEVEKYLNAILKDLEEENCVLIKGAEKETFVKEKQILYIKAETKYCDIILENQDSMLHIRRKGAEVFCPALAFVGFVDGLQVPVVMRSFLLQGLLQEPFPDRFRFQSGS